MKKYCHLCGALYVEGTSQPWECSQCGNLSYENSRPCAEAVIFNQEQQVLISTRGIEPNKGKKDLPGGFVMLSETIEEALFREIKEELNLDPEYFTTPIYSGSWVGAEYKFSKESVTTLTCDFALVLHAGAEVQANDDVAEVAFYDISQIDKLEFSHPSYPAIIRKAYSLLFSNR